MYLIKNNKGFFLTSDNTGFVRLKELGRIAILPSWLTAAQKAAKLGLPSMNIVSIDEIISNLIENLAPLEDRIHELLTTKLAIEDAAKVGGILELKDCLHQEMEKNKYLSRQVEELKKDNERLSLQVEQIGKLIKDC